MWGQHLVFSRRFGGPFPVLGVNLGPNLADVAKFSILISEHGQRFARCSPVFMSHELTWTLRVTCVCGCRWILELMILLAGLASDAEVQVGVGVHNSQKHSVWLVTRSRDRLPSMMEASVTDVTQAVECQNCTLGACITRTHAHELLIRIEAPGASWSCVHRHACYCAVCPSNFHTASGSQVHPTVNPSDVVLHSLSFQQNP